MDGNNDKIQLDDISFDDIVGDVAPSGVVEDLAIPTPEGEDDILDDLPDEELEDSDEMDELEDPEEDEDEYEDDEDDEEDEDAEDEDEEEYDEEYDEEDDEEYAASVVNEVLSNLGYDPSNEYEDTADGLTEMTKEISSKLADERIDNLLEHFPIVKQHLQYVLDGGESNTFLEANNKQGDYELLTLKEEDVNTQRNVLGNYLHLKGHDSEFINELLEDYEDSGKLFNKASLAKTAMAKHQSEHRAEMLERQREETKELEESNQEFWSGVADTIQDSKDFAGIKITEREKRGFYNYISQPVSEDGKTQRDVDHHGADMEVKLAIDYLMYKGFNLDEIVGQRAKTRSVQSLRDKISRNEEDLKSSRRRKRTAKNVDFDDLDLSI